MNQTHGLWENWMVTKKELLEIRQNVLEDIRKREQIVSGEQQAIQALVGEINKIDGKLELLDEIDKEQNKE